MNFDLHEARALLERTPRVLRTWLDGLPGGWTDCREGEGTWSPREVLAHLVHGERTDWIPRVRHLLEHGDAVPFPPFDRAAHLSDSRPLPALLDEFARLRQRSLADLDALGQTTLPLDAPGLHPALGPVALRQLLATWTAHDLGHLTQIARTMARRYAEDVGPWREYLSTIRDWRPES